MSEPREDITPGTYLLLMTKEFQKTHSKEEELYEVMFWNMVWQEIYFVTLTLAN